MKPSDLKARQSVLDAREKELAKLIQQNDSELQRLRREIAERAQKRGATVQWLLDGGWLLVAWIVFLACWYFRFGTR